MRILIDALSARIGGGVTYVENFFPALRAAASPDDSFIMLLSSKYQQNFFHLEEAGFEIIDTRIPESGLWRRWRYLQQQVPQIILREKIDLLFTVTETGVARPTSCPKLALVRNPNFFFEPNNLNSWISKLKSLWYRKTRFPYVAASMLAADRLVFVSQSFRDQVNAAFPAIKVKPQSVVHHGLSPIFLGSSTHGKSNHPYILCVSSVLPHKNMLCLIKAFAALAHDSNFKEFCLLIAGEIEDRDYHRALVNEAQNLGISRRISFLGRVLYEKLPALYSGASVFVMPSSLETFGHPLVEAMASRVPVLASDLPVAREICADSAIYFNPLETQDLTDKLRLLLSNGTLVDQMRDRGYERAKSFSWEKAAQNMLQIFQSIVALKNESDPCEGLKVQNR